MEENNRNPQSPQEIARKAVAWAGSSNASDHSALLQSLSSPAFFNQIDSQEDYNKSPTKKLRIARVFKALIMNDSQVAHQTLVALTQLPTFQNADAREELLVKALAIVRPSPSPAIQYWDAHSGPDSIHVHFTIDALCRNGSEPAIALLERKMLDREQDVDFKLAWMRDSILEHRNDLPLLRGCSRLIRSGLDPDLKGSLVEALCAYRKEEWYKSCSPPIAPPRAQASREALSELRSICEYAKESLTLQPMEKVAVDATLAEIDQLT